MENKNKEKPSETFEFSVNSKNAGERFDKCLSTRPEVQSRSRAQKLIQMNLATINGKIQRSSYLVQENDRISFSIPVETNDLIPLEADLTILHEDEDLAVIYKPSGLVVHPAEGHAQDTLVNILLDKIKNLSMGFNEKRPGIVHRLDKETSGLLVIAKNDSTHTQLAEQFKNRTVKREYYALVHGVPKASQARIETFLARDQKHRKRFKSNSKTGKIAITNYSIYRQFSQGISELRVKLETGRTHQIRVHMSELGHPILNDSLYGADSKCKQLKSKVLQKEIASLHRIALHAAVLGFVHPRTGDHLNFNSEWPSDMKSVLDMLK